MHHRAGPDPDPVAERRPALRVIADGDLLVDPAMLPMDSAVTNVADTVLDEQSGTDPVRVQCEGGSGSVQHTQQKLRSGQGEERRR